jgi:AMP nucleosidase
MNQRISSHIANGFISPHPVEPQEFSDAASAVAALEAIYDRNTRFLCEAFQSLATEKPAGRYRAFYPQISLETTSFGMVDSRLSYGHVVSPGRYAATITRPSLFRAYLTTQFELLLRNHGTPLTVSESETPIPLHFAFGEGAYVEAAVAEKLDMPLRDLFDTPDLATTDDEIVNGLYEPAPVNRSRWPRSRRSASTIRWRACRTTPQPHRIISRISCCLPTTSSTSTNSAPTPAP